VSARRFASVLERSGFRGEKTRIAQKCAALKASADTRDIAECKRRSHDMTRAAVSAAAVARSLVAQRRS